MAGHLGAQKMFLHQQSFLLKKKKKILFEFIIAIIIIEMGRRKAHQVFFLSLLYGIVSMCLVLIKLIVFDSCVSPRDCKNWDSM